MSSPFVSVPAAPQSPENTVVVADGWFPEIDCNETRDVLRLGDVVTHARLEAALLGGMITVMGELAAWRAGHEAEGKTCLAQVAPETTIAGHNRHELLFRRAARFAAAAELAELHRDVTATKEGDDRADVQLLTASDYRRLSTWAIRDILKVTRTAVELI